MAWSSALYTDCQQPGKGYEIAVVSPEIPQPHFLWLGSVGCLPLPSVKRRVSVVDPGCGSATGANFSGSWTPSPK
eukprot:5212151-Amphidinium_carterae.1